MPLEPTLLDMPSEAIQIMEKISSWPKLLEKLNDIQYFSEPSSATFPGLISQPASLQLLHALSKSNNQKVTAKIHHNILVAADILIAAAHITYIKEHCVNGDHVSDNILPDLPDLTSQCIFTSLLLLAEWHLSLMPKVLFRTTES